MTYFDFITEILRNRQVVFGYISGSYSHVRSIDDNTIGREEDILIPAMLIACGVLVMI